MKLFDGEQFQQIYLTISTLSRRADYIGWTNWIAISRST